MNRRILVTGASGFIGSHLLHEMRQAGWTTTGVDLSLRATDSNGLDLLDAAAPEILARIEDGEFDAVLHQAAITDTLTPSNDALEYTNVVTPLRIADACERGRALFVYASSGSVYGSVEYGQRSRETDPEVAGRCGGPLNPYARSKLTLDRRMQGRGGELRWVGLRYTNVFGPGENRKGPMASILSQIVSAAASDRPVKVFADTLRSARDYIPVQTVVATIAALLATPVPSAVYNLGSGMAISFAELLEWCAGWRADELMVRLVSNPIPDRYQYWTCADQSRLAHALPTTVPIRRADIRHHAQQLFESSRREHIAATSTCTQEVS